MNINFHRQRQTDAIKVAQASRQAEMNRAQAELQQGVISLHDFLAPSSVEFFSSYYRLGTKFLRTYWVFGYPRQLVTGWFGSLVNLPEVMDISLFIYPVRTEVILQNLRKKVGQLEAGIILDSEKGRVRDPAKQSQIIDAEEMRDKLQVGEERFFRLGFYYTIYADSFEELGINSKRVDNLLRQQLVYSKPASTQQEGGLNSVLPHFNDQLSIKRNMNTGAIGTIFPFTSADLTHGQGVLYGINMHNQGLVIFDRFSLPNGNSVILAQSGAGKSFMVKLEILRQLMFGIEVIVVDPENEYQSLAEAVGGSHINLSLNTTSRINPFDLPQIVDQDDDESQNALRNNLITLHGLMRLMMSSSQTSFDDRAGSLTPAEEADLDTALIETYARAGITADPLTHQSPPPTIKDLYDTLVHMGGFGPDLAQRLRKYTEGVFAGIFSEQSNVSINNQMISFSVRDLEDELRPVAMYIVLNYIWNRVKIDQKKRILVVDEAWQIMKYPDSANFLFGLTKRARKYGLGITSITQDVEDFTATRLGRAIIANSSLQILLKQSPTAVDLLADIFKLTIEEKKRLAQFPVGQGLFFAGQNHVHIQVVASASEQRIIDSQPKQARPMPTATPGQPPAAGPQPATTEAAKPQPPPMPTDAPAISLAPIPSPETPIPRPQSTELVGGRSQPDNPPARPGDSVV